MSRAVFSHAELVGFPPDSTIIGESAPDNDIYFILAGVVSIRVAQREIAIRVAGQHVGEMAVLDPGRPRSASVVAVDEVVVARVPAIALTELADQHPQLWRNFAKELARRLLQRNRFVAAVNPRPVLFIGCSTESLHLGRAIQAELYDDPIAVRLWTDGIFGVSRYPMEALEQELTVVDFAALVLSPDDRVISRHTKSDAPRDNVLFELGFFMGGLGRLRTFLVYPESTDVKIPTDIDGITGLQYKTITQDDLSAAVAPVCIEMRKSIWRLGSK